jgi:hypothetical protein
VAVLVPFALIQGGLLAPFPPGQPRRVVLRLGLAFVTLCLSVVMAGRYGLLGAVVCAVVVYVATWSFRGSFEGWSGRRLRWLE